MKAPNGSAILAVLEKFGRAQAKRPAGDGWHTLDELAAQKSTTRAAIRYQIQMAQRQGVQFETASGSTVDDEGRPKRTTFYRLKKSP